MSEFTAIRAVSKTLQALLQQAITNSPNPQLQGVPIELASPRELLPGLLMLPPCAPRHTPGFTRCPLLRTGRAWLPVVRCDQ